MWQNICHCMAGCWLLAAGLYISGPCQQLFVWQKSSLLTNSMLSCLGLWFHSDIELLLLQGLYFINKNTTHRMEQQVSIVWELLYLNDSYSHLFFSESSYWRSIICFRGMSSAHAIFITAMSLYLVVSTDLFSDRIKGPITFRNSIISTSALGVLNTIYYHKVAFLLFYSLYNVLTFHLQLT